MASIFFYFGLITFLLSLINVFLNGRSKYLELFNIIPINLAVILLTVLSAIAFFIDTTSFILFLFSLVNFATYADITFVRKFKHKLPEELGKKIKFLDWNTFYFYPENPEKIAEKINSINPDLIFLQELFRTNDKDFKKHLKLTHFADPEDYFSVEGVKHFLPQYQHVVISDDRGIISKYPVKIISEIRANKKFGFLVAEIDIDGLKMLLINVHMPYQRNLTFGYQEKKEIFQKLYEIIWQNKDMPIILAGDFNAQKNSKYIRELFVLLHEAISENSTGIHSSWNVKLSLWRLDFLFHNKLKIEIENANFFTDKLMSDHRGIIADIIVFK